MHRRRVFTQTQGREDTGDSKKSETAREHEKTPQMSKRNPPHNRRRTRALEGLVV